MCLEDKTDKKIKVFDTQAMRYLSEVEFDNRNTRFRIVMTTSGPEQFVYMAGEPKLFFFASIVNPRRILRRRTLLHSCESSAGVAVNALCLIVSGNGSEKSMSDKTQHYDV